MVKNCEPAIYEKLKALAGGDVFFMRADDGNTGPFIIIQRSARLNWRSINNPAGIAQATMQIDAYDVTYLQAKALAASIEDILDGFRGIVLHGSDSPQDFVDIGGISLQNDVDIVDQTDTPLLFRISTSYLVTYKQ